MKQPPRLLDDPAIAPELRSDLKRVASAEPNYDVAAGLVALQAAVVISAAAPATSAAATATAGKSAATALSTKLAIGALSAAAVVAAASALWPQHASTPPRAPTHVHVTAPSAQPQAPVAAPEPVLPSAPSAAPVAPSSAIEPPHARDTRAQQSAPARRDDDAELRREIEQLGRIKALIEREPDEAVRLAREGDREFRRGMLRQERAALAIVALWNAGRQSEAAQRAQSFLARYPESPSRARIERLLRGEQE